MIKSRLRHTPPEAVRQDRFLLALDVSRFLSLVFMAPASVSVLLVAQSISIAYEIVIEDWLWAVSEPKRAERPERRPFAKIETVFCRSPVHKSASAPSQECNLSRSRLDVEPLSNIALPLTSPDLRKLFARVAKLGNSAHLLTEQL